MARVDAHVREPHVVDERLLYRVRQFKLALEDGRGSR